MKSQQSIDLDSLRAELLHHRVLLRLAALEEKGGPDGADWAGAFELVNPEEDSLEALVTGEGPEGQPAEMFNRVCRAVGCLAYLPGGVTFMDRHYEVVKEQQDGSNT